MGSKFQNIVQPFNASEDPNDNESLKNNKLSRSDIKGINAPHVQKFMAGPSMKLQRLLKSVGSTKAMSKKRIIDILHSLKSMQLLTLVLIKKQV